MLLKQVNNSCWIRIITEFNKALSYFVFQDRLFYEN